MALILGVLRLLALLIIATMMVAYTIVLLPFISLAVLCERGWKRLIQGTFSTQIRSFWK